MKNEGTAHCISKLIALKAVIFGKEYTVGDVLNESDKSVPLLVDTEREFTITEETINKWKESLKKKEEKK
jgi:hypothetical protein